MQECLAGLSSLFKLSAEDKGLRFHSHFYNIPETVFSDEKYIRQLVYNITSKVIKYTEFDSVCLTAKYEDDQFLSTCTDTGLGISKKSEKNQLIQGTGLGLSITNTIYEMLGG